MYLSLAPAAHAMRALVAACALAAAAAVPVHAGPVTQTTPATSATWSYASNWTWQNLGTVTLAQGTNQILGLTSTVTLVDQGWGGQDPNANRVVIGLWQDDTALWVGRVAGATHTVRTETFDIASQPAMFDALNAGLDRVDWSANPVLTMRMYAAPLSYPGWQLKTANASFSVTSAEVPEGPSIALAGLGLLLLGVASRRRRAGAAPAVQQG